MRTSAMIAIAATLGSSASPATKSERQKVVVCIEGSGRTKVADAMAMATWLFRPTGVELVWHSSLSFCHGQGDQAIVVSLSANTPKALHPGAFACAFPYQKGVHIQVFYDRIALSFFDEFLSHPLAYVFVHEIAHVLRGTDVHSDSGIMKVLWDSNDYTLMKTYQLEFTPWDIKMIHRGLAVRAARSAAGTLVGAVAP
jgi:hypothetical protein